MENRGISSSFTGMKHQIKGLLLAGVLTTGLLLIALPAMSQTASQIIPVWDGVAPGSED